MRLAFTALLTLLTTFLATDLRAQLIIAHRGASHDAPENTLAAFRLAWKQQADGIEADFYLTTDRQIVCFHDRTTERVAPDVPSRPVSECSLADLRRLDVGSWKDRRFAGERVPVLEEVLDVVPEGKLIFVEIKSGPEILPVLQPQLESSGLDPAQIVIISFDKEVIAGARRRMPQYKANWLTSYKQKTEGGPWKPSHSEVIETLTATGATGLGTKGQLEVIDQTFVDAVRRAGNEFHVWTINEPAEARTFQGLGVDSITTDRPGLIRNVLFGSGS